MTFLTMQQELESRLSVYDLTVATQATKLKRWLNMAVQYICGKRLWSYTEAFGLYMCQRLSWTTPHRPD